MSSSYSYEDCKATADWLLAQTDIRPAVGIVCGSGLGGLADMLKDPVAFNYKDIPNFPQSTGEFNYQKKLSVADWFSFIVDIKSLVCVFCSARTCRSARVRHLKGEAVCLHAGALPLVRGLPSPEGELITSRSKFP